MDQVRDLDFKKAELRREMFKIYDTGIQSGPLKTFTSDSLLNVSEK